MEISSPEKVGTKGLIRQCEFVRVIIQSLYSLGYWKSASLLEEESRIMLQSPEISLFQSQILEGKWDESIATLDCIRELAPEALNSAVFLILQQKFWEYLDKDDTSEALVILRGRMSQLGVDKGKLHKLACCIISRSKREEIGSKLKRGGDSRKKLLNELRLVLPSSVMIPEGRLEHLVELALLLQHERCIYHNSPKDSISLYSDHHCGPDQIPTQTLQILHLHEHEVWYVQFSNKGDYLASSSRDCSAVIWTVAGDGNISLKHILRGHQKPVSFVAWSPDDKLILTCGNGELVKVWDVETGNCKVTIGKGSSGFSSCAWFPDSQRIVCGVCDNGICIYDLEGVERDTWRGQRMPKISDISVTPDGMNLISICDEKDIRIYALEAKTERVISENHPIMSLFVSRDGQYLLVNLNNQEIHMWDVSGTWRDPLKYKGHKQGQYVIRSCFGGFANAFIASGSEDAQVYIWHQQSCKLLAALSGHSSMVNCVSWNPANPKLMASASDDCTIRIWGVQQARPSLRNLAAHASYGTCV
ncbi:unnamed protein product [Victoria cruziana]